MVASLIVNASPLISLGKVSGLWMLANAAFDVHVPRSVADEVAVVATDAAAQWIGEGHIDITPARQPDPILLAWDLGSGETAVIAEAGLLPGAIVVLDDLAARRCARAMGLRCTGTLGVMLMAKQRGLIPKVAPWLILLQQSGLYLSEKLMQDVRIAAGE